VRLLSRYLLRQLAAPFLFALAALTSLMLLSQVAKKFGALVGKGLPWGVIGEVFALSLPFIVAMTLPMAVLVAVLYAFSHLAADNEITAMRASGISVYQILIPVLAWGAFMSAFNFAFVDQVLPRSNASLRGLLIDIGRKKPTLELREQVINEVPPSQYFLRAGRMACEDLLAAGCIPRPLNIGRAADGDTGDPRIACRGAPVFHICPNQRRLQHPFLQQAFVQERNPDQMSAGFRAEAESFAGLIRGPGASGTSTVGAARWEGPSPEESS